MSDKDDIEIARKTYDETCKTYDETCKALDEARAEAFDLLREARAEAFDLLREAYKAHEEAVTGSR